MNWLVKKHEEFLNEYEKDIQSRVNSAFTDVHEREGR